MRWILFLFPFALIGQPTNATLINITPVWGNQELHLDEKYSTINDTVIFETVKFYISAIESNANKKKKNEPLRFHLYDIENPLSKTIVIHPTTKPTSKKITIHFGVDSATHEQGIMPGDLDPTKGMYWTWQTGYINLKLEGKRNDTPFQFHIGGYLSPFNTFQSIPYDVEKKAQYELIIDFKKWFEKSLTIGTSHIMSPGEKAASLSAYIKQCISLR